MSEELKPKEVLTDSITVETLRERLLYNEEDGSLTWLPVDGCTFSSSVTARWWNSRFAGKRAFTTIDSKGYCVGRVNYVRLLAHRVAWALHYGEWPRDSVDHINGVPTDNRIENLRTCSHSENSRNRKIPTSNTSGAMGVCFRKRKGEGGVWQATIKVHGVTTNIGSFAKFEDAVEARKMAEIEHEFHENHGKR